MNEGPSRWARFGRAQRRKRSRSAKVWISGCVAAVLVVAAFYVPRRVQAEGRAVSVESLGELPARAQAAGRLIVATYNVAHGRGGRLGASNWSGGTREEKIRRLEAIGKLLDSRGVQIAVLNEVDFVAPHRLHPGRRASGPPPTSETRRPVVYIWSPQHICTLLTTLSGLA